MAIVPKRLLIITRQVDFSVKIKQALEHSGEVTVTHFTAEANGLEHLRSHPHDVALVDFSGIEMPEADFVLRLRAVQPDIGILAAPDNSAIQQLATDLNLQAVVTIPATARELIPLVEHAARDMLDALPDTAQSPPLVPESETALMDSSDSELHEDTNQLAHLQDDMPYVEGDDSSAETSRTLEFVVSDETDRVTRIRQEGESDAEVVQNIDDALSTFHKLAAEEPPMPGLEDSGTVRDLIGKMKQANLDHVAQGFAYDDETAIPEEPDEDTGTIPAILILETAEDNTTPLEAFSLGELMQNIQEQLPEEQQGIKPLPSWVDESEPYVREPSFLPDELPVSDLAADQLMEYTSSTTSPADEEDIVQQPGELDTDRIEPRQRSRPVTPEDEARLTSELEATEATIPEAEVAPEVPTSAAEAVSVAEASPTDTPDPQILVEADDPYLAQLALTLTQVSLELAAEATLLARDGEVVAAAGDMPREDIDEVRRSVNDDWSAEPDHARIRFLNLPSSGKDYMLYTRYTIDGFTLSMIFAANQQLRLIRRQGKRLAEALESVPEVEEVPVEIPTSLPEVDVPRRYRSAI